MSRIAEALVKAKERTGQTTAPFLAPGAGRPAISAKRNEELVRLAQRRRRFWMGLMIVVLPLTGFAIWTQLTQVSSTPPPQRIEAAQAGGPPEVSAKPAPALAAPDSPRAAHDTRPIAHSAPAPAPRPELQRLVAGFAISAVMPGESPRLMVNGRVVRVGEIIEDGLSFAGIVNSELVFTDSRGATYTRHP